MSINDYPVHKAVFKNDLQTLKKLFNSEELAKKDKHGNTPLHIAVALGHKECIDYLIDQDVPVKIKNNQGWSTLAEAISYGDRQTIVSLLATLKKQARNTMKNRRPNLIKALNEIGNFYMEIKWDFTSWLPFVSRSLPSDVSKIYKKGCNIRLDSTLSGLFDDFTWKNGDISFLFLGDYKIGRSFIFMDNKEKYYQKIKKDLKSNLEDEVDILMSNDIVALQLNTKEIAFTRAHSGWLFKEKRTEMIGNFVADFYSISGLCLESKKRREHLTEQDLANENVSFTIGFKNNEKSSKTDHLSKSNSLDLSNNLSNSNGTNDSTNSDDFINERRNESLRRKSLPKPEKQNITWEEYINSDTDKLPCLGRKMVCKQSVKKFKATIGMSQNFPLTTSSLLNILEVLAPFKHFNKLREFIEVKLPPGFPIEIDIPILPTITAHITFQEFRFDDNLDDNLFKVPDDYEKIKSDTF